MNTIRISKRASLHTSPEQKRTHMLFALSLACIVALSSMVAGCGSVQGTKSDYFGFRNNIPAPAPEVEQEVSQQAWTNPMQSGVSSSVAFVPVVTPWYDGWSMFARPSARFWGVYDRMGWNSPWGGDPFYGGGYGYSGWGGNSWAFNSYYDPFWGCGSSFMLYSSPWQRYNPYFGAYTPFGFYRPLGYWSSQNFTSYNNNLNVGTSGGGNGDVYSPSRMRDAGVQRAYGNNASAYTGTNSYNNSTYVGTYTTNGATGGALSRGQGTGAEYKQNNPNNRASQYNSYSAGGNAASNYSNYYSNPLINSGTTTKYSGYNSGGEATRYYPSSPSTNSVRSYGGYSGGASYSGSSSGNSSGGGWGGGKSSGGYSGGSTSGGSTSGGSSSHSSGSSSGGSHSTGGSSGGGARSRGGH